MIVFYDLSNEFTVELRTKQQKGDSVWHPECEWEERGEQKELLSFLPQLKLEMVFVGVFNKLGTVDESFLDTNLSSFSFS